MKMKSDRAAAASIIRVRRTEIENALSPSLALLLFFSFVLFLSRSSPPFTRARYIFFARAFFPPRFPRRALFVFAPARERAREAGSARIIFLVRR